MPPTGRHHLYIVYSVDEYPIPSYPVVLSESCPLCGAISNAGLECHEEHHGEPHLTPEVLCFSIEDWGCKHAFSVLGDTEDGKLVTVLVFAFDDEECSMVEKKLDEDINEEYGYFFVPNADSLEAEYILGLVSKKMGKRISV